MYTIKAAAEATGIAPATLRAWERRYAVVRPQRTAAGYRLYDEHLIQDLRLMRDLVALGHPPHQAAGMVGERRAEPSAPQPVPPVSDLIAAAQAADPSRIAAAVDAGMAAPLPDAVDRWLMPALSAVGQGWADGTVGVSTEHLITHAVHRALSAQLYRYSATAQGDSILVGLPEGSHHELGALAFAALAARDALRVCYLGSGLPPADWVNCALDSDATAAVIAVPTRADVPAARRTAKALAGLPGVRVCSGGAHQSDLGGATQPLGHDLVAAVAHLRSALDGRVPQGSS